MKISKIVLTAVAATAASWSALAADISGAGATFPYPVYAKWADAYKKDTGIGLNYQSIGSGGGIKQIKAKTVTFGATDAPLPGKELDTLLRSTGLRSFGPVNHLYKQEAPGRLKNQQDGSLLTANMRTGGDDIAQEMNQIRKQAVKEVQQFMRDHFTIVHIG